MEHFETATRDPAFFRLHKYMDNLVKEHKDLLPPYNRVSYEIPLKNEQIHKPSSFLKSRRSFTNSSRFRFEKGDLDVEGVTVDAVKVMGKSKASTPNHLITYFQDFYFDLSNALDTSENVKDVDVQAKVRRLSHEPFEYVITATSATEKNVVARIFIAPKYNYYGEEQCLESMRWGVVELDKFVVHLKPGQNVLRRASEESSVTIPDRKGFKVMMKEVKEAIEGKKDLFVDKHVRHCGLPHGLLIPKVRP